MFLGRDVGVCGRVPSPGVIASVERAAFEGEETVGSSSGARLEPTGLPLILWQ